MPNTDFFDDDLIKQHDSLKRIKPASALEPIGLVSDAQSSDEVPVRPLADINLTRMARYKQEVSEQHVEAAQELERLRKRQEDLEREKRELEELQRKQDEYVRGRKDILERLGQSLVVLEKDEIQAQRLTELLGTTRRRFKEMTAQISAISEDIWPEGQMRDELNKALALVEDSRGEFNKAMSKIDAVLVGGKKIGELQPSVYEQGRATPDVDRPFGFWFKVGFAVTLPLVLVVLVITGVFIVLKANALI